MGKCLEIFNIGKEKNTEASKQKPFAGQDINVLSICALDIYNSNFDFLLIILKKSS